MTSPFLQYTRVLKIQMVIRTDSNQRQINKIKVSTLSHRPWNLGVDMPDGYAIGLYLGIAS